MCIRDRCGDVDRGPLSFAAWAFPMRRKLRNLRRLASILYIWLAGCSKPAVPPTLEAAYNAQLDIAEATASSCKEVLANIAAVEKQWATVWPQYASRPFRNTPVLVCHDGGGK